MKKRIVSLLLVLCLVLVQLPVLAVEAQEEAVVTGLSITVDGVTYTEGNVIIKPNSTVVYTVTGTNLHLPTDQYILEHTIGVTSLISSGTGWDADETHTTASRDYSDRIYQFVKCDNFRVSFILPSGERVYTDIYLTYDDGSTEADLAEITGLSLVVDGVTYTQGHVTLRPEQDVLIIVHGNYLRKATESNILDTPGVYVYVDRMTLQPDGTCTQTAIGSWFEGGVDYPLTYTNDAWATTIDSGITVTCESGSSGPAMITDIAINVDGVTYTEGNVIIRPNSTVSFIVMGENLDNANQQQIIDTPFAYLPLHSIYLEDNTIYPYVTYSSVFQGGTNYRITYTNDAWATTIPTDIYVTYQEGPSLWTLTADTDTQLSLTEDLYVDLNGFDLSGSIALNGYKVYGIDSTTNSYTCDNIGSFNCVDENGNAIVPVSHFKNDITGSVKRYMAIKGENGYSFHRFYLGITHMSLNTKVTGFGYKAEFYGDELVRSQIQSIGYNLWLTEDNIVSSTTDFKNTLTLRLENFDIGNYGQTPVNACVSMTLLDGTVLESSTVSYSMRQMVEMINDNTQNYQTTVLQKVAQMILNNQPMETWLVDNILAVLN